MWIVASTMLLASLLMVFRQESQLAMARSQSTTSTLRTNSNLYIDNPEAASVINSELDGVTITLTIKAGRQSKRSSTQSR